MLKKIEKYLTIKRFKLKRRVRKGIPENVRGLAWIKLSNLFNIKQYKEKLYSELVNQIKIIDKSKEGFKDEQIIINDISRTFPRNSLFKDKLGEGQRALFRILACYSLYDNRTGYVQGMGFFVGMFLTYMNEENSFWMLINIIHNYSFLDLYSPGLPGLKKSFYVYLHLVKKLMPNVYQLFKEFNVFPSLYASSWFLTCFCNILPFDTVARIFDCLMIEGFKVIYRISLSLIKMKEKEICKCENLNKVLSVLKTVTQDVQEEKMFCIAFDFSFSRKDIEKYEEKYKKNEEGDEIMGLLGY